MLTGKYFYTSEGVKTQGNITTRSASSTTVTSSITYSSGYYPNEWTVSGLDTSDANATEDNIEEGYTAYVNGVKIIGSALVQHRLAKYTGSIENLSKAKLELAATSIGDYALFGGGKEASYPYQTDTVESYDSNLTKSNPNVLSVPRQLLAAASNSSYALFGGGEQRMISGFNTVDAYDVSLVHSIPQQLYGEVKQLAGTSTNNYALFGGGDNPNAQTMANVYAYNTSLTASSVASLSIGRRELLAASNSNYSLFFGGTNNNNGTFTKVSTVDAYNTSLTKTSATACDHFHMTAVASMDDYVIIAAGENSSGTAVNTVDSYNKQLTKTTISPLTKNLAWLAGACIKNFALFTGGVNGSPLNDIVYTYDSNLSLSSSTVTSLSAGKYNLVGCNNNKYALFGAGSVKNGSTYSNSNTVEAYYIK